MGDGVWFDFAWPWSFGKRVIFRHPQLWGRSAALGMRRGLSHFRFNDTPDWVERKGWEGRGRF